MNDSREFVPGAHHFSQAGFISRLAAFVLDWIILSAAAGITTAMMRDLVDLFGLQRLGWGRYVLLGATVSTASLLSFFSLAVLWHLAGCSPGKAIIGLRVVNQNGQRPTLFQATVRLLGYWVSALPLFLGFFWCLFDEDRQTWHDKMARTYVVHAPLRADRLGIPRNTLSSR